MIVGYEQNDNGVQIAYINKKGQISTEQHQTQFSKYEKCLDTDPNKSHLKNYLDGSAIRRLPSYRFGQLEMREFLLHTLDESKREPFLEYNTPNIYSVDIEIDMSPPKDLLKKNVYVPKDVTEKQLMGFPDPDLAYRPIESISITAPDLSTIVLTTSVDRVSEGDHVIIEKKINDYFKEHHIPSGIIKELTNGNRIRYNHRTFKSESDLLKAYIQLQREFMHTITGWNWTYFDATYISNRCRMLDVDLSLASPLKRINKRTGIPIFRLEFDAMEWCDKFGAYEKTAKGLGYVSKQLLGIGKVEYVGSFIDLYNGDYTDFLFYNAIDTILVQMIVQKYSIMSTPLTLSYYAKIPIYGALSVTAISDAMWFDELYHNGVFNANLFDTSVGGGDYEGGYVLDPRRSLSDFIAIMDYASLYPKSIETLNCSPDAIVGRIDMNDSGAFKRAKAAGYAISMNGTLYKNDGDNTLKTIVSRHLDERYYFKGLKFKIEQNILPTINEEMKRRGLI